MAIEYTGESTAFIAGESAPSGTEVLLCGAKVVNDLGTMALDCFKPNKLKPHSEARLDFEVDPPVLRLSDALTTILSGYTDPNTGEFVQQGCGLPGSRRIVSGTYSGPGSELTVV